MTRKHISKRERALLFIDHKGRCSLCHGIIRVPFETWDVEHTIPLSLGGADDPSNWTVVHSKCHRAKTRDDMGALGKARRREAKHIGAKAPSRNPLPGGRNSLWKKRLDGTVVRRTP